MREIFGAEPDADNSDDEEGLFGDDKPPRKPLLMHPQYNVPAKNLIPSVYGLEKEDTRLRREESAVILQGKVQGATMSLAGSIASCIQRARKQRVISATARRKGEPHLSAHQGYPGCAGYLATGVLQKMVVRGFGRVPARGVLGLG
eukprot:4826440-Pleurochrysis_carterae.AAC.1